MRIKIPMALTAMTTCVAMVISAPSWTEPRPRYLDARAPARERAADLLRRMTLNEKIGQMGQIVVTRMQGDCAGSGGALRESCMKTVLRDNAIGSVLSGAGNGPRENTPAQWAAMVNSVQRHAVENSRLRIPVLYGVDAVHGHNNVLGATIFPHQIGLGATWDREAARRTGAATARAVGATGIDWNFSPVADIARDQRWGRYYETYGEDPLLAGVLAKAAAEGTESEEGAGGGKRVAATVKHFGGYSEPSNGHDRVPADVSMRYLHDTLLAPFRPAIEAGAKTVMVNSGAVNGVPATASEYLLTTVLRERWGFEGVTVSDWEDVRALRTRYKVAKDYPEAIALAVNAGLDMAMEPFHAQRFTDGLRTAVRRGLVTEERIDRSVERVLKLKLDLGLFEDPYVDPAKADAAVRGADRKLARRTATDSQVLLRNQDGVLPIADTADKIVVAGPYADDIRGQTGGWTIGWHGVPKKVKLPGTTVLRGIERAAPQEADVVHAKNTDTAVQEAAGADVAVVVVGEKPGAEGEADSPRPELTAGQQRLVRRLKESGTPVVTVVLAGRPLALGAAAGTEGLLMSWLPGTEGGHAVADILFGKANPSGRMPVSWPKRTGNEPMYYQQLPGTNKGAESSYDAAHAFGDGLSYTTYTVRSLTPAASRARVGAPLEVAVKVANTGERDGDMVVPLYAARPVSQVLAPRRRLVAFDRVRLKAGTSRTVRLKVPPRALAVTPGDIDGSGAARVEPGAYVLTAGKRSARITLR